jgi:hypothetical protein
MELMPTIPPALPRRACCIHCPQTSLAAHKLTGALGTDRSAHKQPAAHPPRVTGGQQPRRPGTCAPGDADPWPRVTGDSQTGRLPIGRGGAVGRSDWRAGGIAVIEGAVRGPKQVRLLCQV